MARARVIFGSDTNRAHFVIDLSEQLGHGPSVTVEEDDSVSFYVDPSRHEDIDELAATYGGEVEWADEY